MNRPVKGALNAIRRHRSRNCGLSKITMRKVIFGDYSAKAFQRPPRHELLAGLKRTEVMHKNLV
jgi:hypothetical protein